jgi:cytochrome P450
MTARLVREPVDLGGRRIRRGEWVILWLGAANRDPARFPDPDRLDLERTDNKHLAFGSGAHFCLGAPLARMQGQIVVGTLFRRFPEMRLADGPLVWERNPTLRGLTSLPVVLGPGQAG